ncbi:uncharacterized protein LOC134210041 [Armigeres subalbatus]|uniref:uncharacterized protein LOC134210041 n=1 Tax=Armigeres subalbatus TaxID=124917 RepID=UPI002ECFF425
MNFFPYNHFYFKVLLTIHRMVLGIAILIILLNNWGSCARVKEYVQEKAAICAVPNADQFALQLPGPFNYSMGNKNTIKFYGNFTITTVIQEPLELVIIANRCTLNMKSCELFNKVTLTDLCRHINDQKGVMISFFKSIDPIFQCPIKPGLYQFKNSVVDLSFVSIFPLEGYRWQTSLKLYSKTKPMKELFCLSSQSFMHWVKKT